MGQKFVPELHDPDCRRAVRTKTADLSEIVSDAIIARMDAEEREPKWRD
ncbi:MULTISPECIES: hypothetical protein [Paracoccus]|nr:MULTISPECIES: hypothetical protein [Paracoccus]SMG51519.1 hypothetical protein SAMN02746000_03221 [Paracoccus sp. J56]